MALTKARKAPITSAAHAKRELQSLTSCWSYESLLNPRMLVYLCELLEKGKKKSSRKASKYQQFFAAGAKSGKSAQQIAEEWKRRKD